MPCFANRDEYIQEAKDKAESIIREAEEQSSKLLEDTQSSADEILKGLHSDEERLKASIDRLTQFENRYREQLKRLLHDNLALLDS